MGTDVRKLVADGYPATNVLGCDLRQEFVDCGYQLYQDKQTCDIHFFTSDIFDLPYPPHNAACAQPTQLKECTKLEDLVGRITHCYLGAIFHLFDEHTQYVLALRVASLMRRSPGTVVFGRHESMIEAGEIPTPEYP